MRRDEQTTRDKYINELFATEDHHLQKVRRQLREDGKEGINVGPYEGKLLQVLANLVDARVIVEIGTLYGYSTLWMARALPEGGKIISIEKDEQNYRQAEQLLKQTEVASRVQLVLGDAVEALEQVDEETIDMTFIDANKSAYTKYLDWAEVNVRKGGLIVGDNTFLFGHVIGEGASNQAVNEKQVAVMKDFNRRLANPEMYNSVLVPTTEGLTVAKKMF